MLPLGFSRELTCIDGWASYVLGEFRGTQIHGSTASTSFSSTVPAFELGLRLLGDYVVSHLHWASPSVLLSDSVGDP